MFISPRQKPNRTVLFRWGIVLVFAFFVWRFSAFTHFLEKALFSVAEPVWRAEGIVTKAVQSRAPLWKSKQSLVTQNGFLAEQNAFLRAELYVLPVLKKENEELKELLGRAESGSEALSARVLVRPGRSLYDTLILDRGGEDGVAVGDIITAYGDVALGTVERVYARTAVALLFSSPGESVEVILGEGGTPVIAEGAGGGAFTVSVPKGLPVKEGDTVVFPAAEVALLGVVGAVESAPGASFQNVFFQFPVNLYELKWVEVLMGGMPGSGIAPL